MYGIRLFRHRFELRGTLYFEFQRRFRVGHHWQDDSVYIREEFWADLGSIIFRRFVGYNHHGTTTIPSAVWQEILLDFEQLEYQIRSTTDRESLVNLLPVLTRWYEPVGGENWRRYALQYAMMIRDLSKWIRKQLDAFDTITILGI